MVLWLGSGPLAIKHQLCRIASVLCPPWSWCWGCHCSPWDVAESSIIFQRTRGTSKDYSGARKSIQYPRAELTSQRHVRRALRKDGRPCKTTSVTSDSTYRVTLAGSVHVGWLTILVSLAGRGGRFCPPEDKWPLAIE